MKTMPRVPLRFYWFVLGLWLLAITAIGAALRHQPLLPATESDGVLVALALIVFIALAGAMPLVLSPMIKIHVGTAPLFAATLLFPVPIAAGIGLVGTVAYHAYLQARRRRIWQDTAFNSGRTVLQIAVAGFIFHAATPNHGWLAIMSSPSLAVAVIGSALAYYVVNVSAVHLATVTITGQKLFRLWWATMGIEGVQQAALLLFGVVTALVVDLYPILGLAMVFPVCVVYSSFRSSGKLRAHTQSAVEAIADAVDMRAYGTVGHSLRVADLSERVALRLGLNKWEVMLVRRAARVHDIGKVGFSDAVLRHEEEVSPEEAASLQKHPAYGAEILAPFAEYQRCRQFVRYHHEQPDGAGYPEGRAGSQIPLGAAIIAVAEAFDSLTTERPYRQTISAVQACDRLLKGSDTIWNATVVRSLLEEIQAQAPERQAAAVPSRTTAQS